MENTNANIDEKDFISSLKKYTEACFDEKTIQSIKQFEKYLTHLFVQIVLSNIPPFINNYNHKKATAKLFFIDPEEPELKKQMLKKNLTDDDKSYNPYIFVLQNSFANINSSYLDFFMELEKRKSEKKDVSRMTFDDNFFIAEGAMILDKGEKFDPIEPIKSFVEVLEAICDKKSIKYDEQKLQLTI